MQSHKSDEDYSKDKSDPDKSSPIFAIVRGGADKGFHRAPFSRAGGITVRHYVPPRVPHGGDEPVWVPMSMTSPASTKGSVSTWCSVTLVLGYIETPRARRNGAGLVNDPPIRIFRSRWHPLTTPVAPTLATPVPAVTRSPTDTRKDPDCR